MDEARQRADGASPERTRRVSKTGCPHRGRGGEQTNHPTGYSQVLEERTTTGTGPAAVTTFQTYTYGSDLISQSVSSSSGSPSLAFFAYDGLASVRELTDEAGFVTDTFDYDAFGVLIHRSGTTENSYLYRGERLDSDIGQYYLRARFYNQNSGRFWNVDTYEGRATDPASLHKYLYAHANPVNGIDPSGKETLMSVMQAQGVSVMMQVARIGPAFAAGGVAIGRVWNALATAAQNAAQSVMMLYSQLQVFTQVTLPNSTRVIDFTLRVGQQFALLETKYKIPSRLGDSMSRLVGQMNAAIASGQGQIVLWTYKAPTSAEISLFYQQMGTQA